MASKVVETVTLGDLRRDRYISAGRYELKYLLRPELAEKVANSLASYLEMDDHCRGKDANSYTVRSIYFDSPDFKCFHEKLGGQKHREKFRIRTYDHFNSTPLFLEDKIKNDISYIKLKGVLTQDIFRAIKELDYNSLSELDIPEKDRRILEKFFFRVYRQAYFPVALVAYDREAYVYPGQDEIRVTLDKNLRAMMFPALEQLHDEVELENVLHDVVILEIKFPYILPREIGLLATRFDLQARACSKYCTCVAHFLGEIPSFKDGVAYVSTG